jgi:copper oxidase (laccase) domain-containing protein
MEITIGYSARGNGNMGLTLGESGEVKANRKGYLDFLAILPEQTAFMSPQHGDTILEVTKEDLKKMPPEGFKCDGLYTTDKDIALAFPPADCLAVYFYNKNFSAVIHAGKQGILNTIIQKALTLFVIRGLVSSKDKVKVTIGPYIKECCYVFSMYPHRFTRWAQSLRKYLCLSDDDDFSIDLGNIARDIFSKKNFSRFIDGDVAIVNQCTCCTKDHNNKFVYFSHGGSNRHSGDRPEGRNLAVIKRN